MENATIDWDTIISAYLTNLNATHKLIDSYRELLSSYEDELNFQKSVKEESKNFDKLGQIARSLYLAEEFTSALESGLESLTEALTAADLADLEQMYEQLCQKNSHFKDRLDPQEKARMVNSQYMSNFNKIKEDLSALLEKEATLFKNALDSFPDNKKILPRSYDLDDEQESRELSAKKTKTPEPSMYS